MTQQNQKILPLDIKNIGLVVTKLDMLVLLFSVKLNLSVLQMDLVLHNMMMKEELSQLNTLLST